MEFSGCFEGVSRECRGCFEGVLRVFHGSVKGVLRGFQGCFKGMYIWGLSIIQENVIKNLYLKSKFEIRNLKSKFEVEI